jgi:ABC-2 type transport system permease protein
MIARLNLIPVAFARDTWLVFQRQMLLVIRTPVWIAVGLIQPIVYLTLFAPMLKQALTADGEPSTYANAYMVYVPGLLVAIATFGGFFSGFGLLAELRAGIIERVRVTPVNRQALLLGRALREVVNMLFQALVITLLALPFGLRVPIGDLLLAYLLFTVLTLAVVAVSYGIALLIKNEGALGPVYNTISQPVALVGGVLLPLALAPLWLRRVADWNPFYWATSGIRALYAGHPGQPVVWEGAVVVAALAAIGIGWSSWLFQRSLR